MFNPIPRKIDSGLIEAMKVECFAMDWEDAFDYIDNRTYNILGTLKVRRITDEVLASPA